MPLHFFAYMKYINIKVFRPSDKLVSTWRKYFMFKIGELNRNVLKIHLFSIWNKFISYLMNRSNINSPNQKIVDTKILEKSSSYSCRKVCS